MWCFSVLTKRLAGKSVSKVTYFCRVGRVSLTQSVHAVIIKYLLIGLEQVLNSKTVNDLADLLANRLHEISSSNTDIIT